MSKNNASYVVALAVIFVGTVAHGYVTGRWTAAISTTEALPSLPMTIDQWRGESLKGELNDPRLCSLTRRYTNSKTGRSLTMSLTIGPAGLTAQHTPEYCYPSSGFHVVDQAQSFAIPGRNDQFRTAIYGRSIGSAAESIRIFWAWSADGSWTAPSYPEVTFVGKRVLQKLYIVSDITDRPPNDDAQLCDFLKCLMSELKTHKQ